MTVMLIKTPSLCRTCFCRRNEIALRIASSIYTSNCAYATTVVARTPPALRCSLAPLVARFEPEWNSPDDNKTRFFNILGAVEGGRNTVFQQSRRPTAIRDHSRRWSRTRDNDGGKAGRLMARSGRWRAARDHPAAQPCSDRTTTEVKREHDQAEIEPVAETAGNDPRKRGADQRRDQGRKHPSQLSRDAFAVLNHRYPAHGEAEQHRCQQPAPIECGQIGHAHFTTKSMRRFCALPSPVSLAAIGCDQPSPTA